MQPRKFRILSAVTAGRLALGVVAITASSGTSQPAKHAALAAQTESFPPVTLDDCPTLHTGYPVGGCVAQLQTELNLIPGNHLVVDGTFGPKGSQTWNAITAFQGAHDLPRDGMVGTGTKNALKAAVLVPPGSSVSTPVLEPPPATQAPGTSAASGETATMYTGQEAKTFRDTLLKRASRTGRNRGRLGSDVHSLS